MPDFSVRETIGAIFAPIVGESTASAFVSVVSGQLFRKPGQEGGGFQIFWVRSLGKTWLP
jgi:hypothetical protein